MFFANITNEVRKWYYGPRDGIRGIENCPDEEMKQAAKYTILYGATMIFLHLILAVLSFSFIRDKWTDVLADVGLKKKETDDAQDRQ